MANLDERADRNIPDPVERRLYRGRMADAASRAAHERGPDPDAIWAEAAGPGSYRWVWTRWIQTAPTTLSWVALAFCLGGVLGWALDLPWLAGNFLNGPAFPLASAISIGLLSIALLLLRPDQGETAAVAGNAIAFLVFATGAPTPSAAPPFPPW